MSVDGSRAAVLIGVDRTGGLEPLLAAASGATDMSGWLEAEGFACTLLADQRGPVKLSAVKDAVRLLVERGTLEQIVVYFAGHGYLNGTAETWLLSGAPIDPDEAIDLTESSELARSCGVRSVVFISDACRSTPQSLGASRVRGGSILPNLDISTVEPEVDRFFASRPGQVALELSLEEARRTYVGLFTELLQKAHVNPETGLTKVMARGTEIITVVPSRKLKLVLPDLVNRTAQARSLRLNQVPQLRLESGEDAYLARATFSGPSSTFAPGGASSTDLSFDHLAGSAFEAVESGQPRPEPSLEAIARRALSHTFSRHDKSDVDQELQTRFPDFFRTMEAIREKDEPPHFETETAIQVNGGGSRRYVAFLSARYLLLYPVKNSW
jgi:Caspase domain